MEQPAVAVAAQYQQVGAGGRAGQYLRGRTLDGLAGRDHRRERGGGGDHGPAERLLGPGLLLARVGLRDDGALDAVPRPGDDGLDGTAPLRRFLGGPAQGAVTTVGTVDPDDDAVGVHG